MSVQKLVAFSVAAMILAGCNDSATKAEAETPANNPVSAAPPAEAPSSADKSALIKRRDELKPRFEQLRSAFVAARDALREKTRALEAAQVSQNLALVTSLQSDIAGMQPLVTKARDEFEPVMKEWNRLSGQIKNLP